LEAAIEGRFNDIKREIVREEFKEDKDDDKNIKEKKNN